jgi:hypothetical protein
MEVRFRVDYHAGTGRRTLKMKTGDDTTYRDCHGSLLSNDDAGAFYRAVAKLLYESHTNGDVVDYQDTNLD